MSAFEENWKRLVDIEGGYVDDPSDSGGATRWGVTELVARRHGYTGSMRRLPKDTAMSVAKLEFWDTMLLDTVAFRSKRIASEMFDTGYNMGPNRSVRFLQRALNALNRGGKDYDDQTVDGKMGRRTLAALTEFLLVRPRNGETVLYRCLDSLQGARYIQLVERREKDERFLYGWMLHRTT